MAKKKAKKNLCERCSGLCCRYFALPIETPEDRDDYDDIRWYLCHEGTSVFVEDGDWYINIQNKCKYLSEKTYKCTNYEKRPKICRKYTTDDCDLVEGEYDYELHFTDDKQMLEYIKVKFDNKANKNKQEVKKRVAAKKKAQKLRKK
jgi:Fe-S-cluster containining protein